MKLKSEFLIFLLLGFSLLTSVAYGSRKGQSEIFKATLAPLNSNVSGLISGTVEIIYEWGTFEVRTSLAEAPDSPHLQYIYMGKSCPDPSTDTNQDRFIDGIEAQTTAGEILMDLDDEISLAGKVVIIHGVPSTTSLPETVRGIDSENAQVSLPIACGVLVRQQ